MAIDRLFLVFIAVAVLAFLLAGVAISCALFVKDDPRYWVQATIDRGRAEVFFYSLCTALVFGAAAWVIQP